MHRYGAIEAGGTKFVCAVGSGPEQITDTIRIDTTSPGTTLGAVIDFFRQHHASVPLEALGIACFGPIELDKSSPAYGYITTTPKAGWAQTDIVSTLQSALNLPTGFDTDVNAAALGEHRWGAAQDVDSFIYLTVGTGIGGGAMVEGELLHGLLHPEMGHILLPRHDSDTNFSGVCPFHGTCFEGLASGPAIQARWGRPADELDNDHDAWSLQAHYMAVGLWNLICTLSPRRLILGGGVMEQEHLLPAIRANLQSVAAEYLQVPQLGVQVENFVVAPGLGSRAGISGALALAELAARNVP
ncbi:MAG: ROK family protein [Gemmatimonadetes bacterium]|jgi:fructokinase|nr:ROK family protein [Gemmatimonadota bacterium]MBT4611091.1 ROK family protein [Gemmatimonadota bacterium]MBT5144210.1 ROK family protein [Gemmatimonadota bacterium]MBT5588764.1 ROK family protein [Gemmatimonadota bacterium]MBT5964518.1 ROK family protein [Gemmatimonadota bacterium]